MGIQKTQFTKHDYSKPYGKFKIHQNKKFKIRLEQLVTLQNLILAQNNLFGLKLNLVMHFLWALHFH